MAIADQVERAIARITFDGSATAGTGFLIAPHLVVTARHVFESYTAGATYRVRFCDDPIAEFVLATEPYYPASGDWALITVPTTHARTPLIAQTRRASVRSFDTSGYVAGVKRTPYCLELLTFSSQHIHTRVVGGQAIQAKGMSGAPLLCDHYVVGVVTEASTNGDGTFRALPIDAIACHLNLPHTDPPFTARAASLLCGIDAPLLRQSVAKAGLPVPVPVESQADSLRLNAAASSLRGGVASTALLVEQLAPAPLDLARACQLVYWAANQWIAIPSIAALRALFAAPTPFIVVKANYPQATLERYLQLLDELDEAHPKADFWNRMIALPTLPPDAPLEVMEAVNVTLAAKYPEVREEDRVAELGLFGPPIVLLDRTPSKSVLDAIGAALLGQPHVVLAVATGVPHTGVELVPGPDLAAEAREHDAMLLTHRRLKRKRAS